MGAPLLPPVDGEAREMILAAAIKGEDGTIWTLPPPARHANIGWFMCDNGHPVPFPGGENQGFIASWPEGANMPVFVNRWQAMRIARRYKQILPGEGRGDLLFSEDLW